MKNVNFKSVLLASLLFSGFVLATSCKEEKSDINNDPNETGMGEYGQDTESTGDTGTGTASDTTSTNGTGTNGGSGTGTGTGNGGGTGSGAGAQPTVPGGTQ